MSSIGMYTITRCCDLLPKVGLKNDLIAKDSNKVVLPITDYVRCIIITITACGFNKVAPIHVAVKQKR